MPIHASNFQVVLKLHKAHGAISSPYSVSNSTLYLQVKFKRLRYPTAISVMIFWHHSLNVKIIQSLSLPERDCALSNTSVFPGFLYVFTIVKAFRNTLPLFGTWTLWKDNHDKSTERGVSPQKVLQKQCMAFLKMDGHETVATTNDTEGKENLFTFIPTRLSFKTLCTE